ncbi:MAG: hypothetical protein HGA80_00835 [Candidatus Omnitrophica bacterium]|nr:hypothetical protein [Candidatus Omnitrophota bacterium]
MVKLNWSPVRSFGISVFFLAVVVFFCPVSAEAAPIRHFFATASGEQTNSNSGTWTTLTGTAGLNTTGSTNGWIAGSNFTVGRRYLLMLWGYHGTSGTNNNSGLRVMHGATSFTESEGTEETDRSAYRTSYFWFTVWTAANEDVVVQSYDNGGTAYADDITLLAIDAEDLITNNDLKYDIQLQPGSAALTTTFAAKSTVTWTPANNGDSWWLMAYSRGDIQNISGNTYQAQLNIDGAVYTSQVIDGEDANDSPIYGLGWAKTMTNASHTVSVEIRENPGNQGWFAAGVLALRLNALDNFGIGATKGSQNLDAGLNTYKTIATVSKTINDVTSEWLVTGGFLTDDNNGRARGKIMLNGTTDMTGAYGGWQAATTDVVPWTAADVYVCGGGNSYQFDVMGVMTSSVSPVPAANDAWEVAVLLGPVRTQRVLTAD